MYFIVGPQHHNTCTQEKWNICGKGNSVIIFFISRRALAREGDYEMMPVCVCVRACVRALVSHADSSKTTTATDFL